MAHRADERDVETRPETQKETRSAAQREASAERLAKTPADTPTTPIEAAGGSQGGAGLTRMTRRDDGGTAGEGARAQADTAAGEERRAAPGKSHRGEEHGERPSGEPSALHGEGAHGTPATAATTGKPGETGSTWGSGNATSARTVENRDTSEADVGGSGTRPVLPRSESDDLALRLQHAVSGFVDGPRVAVEEADTLFEEASARITESLAERRRLLRSTWQDKASTGEDDGSTEELRTVLRDYRDVVQHLLTI
jgi:hypothetical protein